MKNFAHAICIVVSCAAARSPAAEPASLFDGRTFAGWEGNLAMFRIDEGAIVGGTLREKVPHNEFLCTTREYGDFELRVKFKLLGDGANAGIQFRSQRVAGHHEVRGYQADMGGKYWGSLYDESRRRKTLVQPDLAAVMKIVRTDDWNEYVIRAEGPHIQLRLNGMLTVDYVETDDAIERTGIIGLQIHGGPPSEAWYKDLTIIELPSGAAKGSAR